MGQEVSGRGCRERVLWCCSEEHSSGKGGLTGGGRDGLNSPQEHKNQRIVSAGDLARDRQEESPSLREPRSVGSAARGGTGGGRRGRRGGPSSERVAPSLDVFIEDLEGSERRAYGEAFGKLDLHGAGAVPPDCAALRSLILENSALKEAELDVELLKVGSLDEGGLSLPSLLQLLRDNAVADTAAIEEFLNSSSDGVTSTSVECRSRLLLVGESYLGAQFTEDQWDKILNAVMMDADVTIQLEQWLSYCNAVARIIRLVKFVF